MAATEVSICNQALGWCGSEPIISLDDDTPEAKLCKANYANIRDACLEDYAWTFATRREVLSPTQGEPSWGYEHQFVLPPDTIRVLSVEENENALGYLDWVREQNFILANVETVYIRYTARIEDPVRFTSAFTQALAHRLAADFAIPLAESRKLQENHWAIYQEKLMDAVATDGMQGRAERTQASRLRGSRSGFYPGSRGYGIGPLFDP